MNCIRSVVLFCLFFCAYACLSAVGAEGKVVSVRAEPQWPWQGKVDIYYTVECDDTNADVELTFTGYDGDTEKTLEIRKSYLSGDGIDTAVEFGKEMHAVWNAAADIPDYHSNAFKVKVTAEFTSKEGLAYMVIDLSGGSSATSYPVRYTNDAPDVTKDTCRTTELWLRRIPAGTFLMGSPANEVGRYDDETLHNVTITEDFYIGIFECTQRQYELIMNFKPSGYSGDTRPVERVSYENIRGTGSTAGAGWPKYGHTVDSSSFMGKLQARTKLTFDLPTEAQWEYACRKKADGTCWTTALNSGKNLTDEYTCDNMAEVGQYIGNFSEENGGYSEHTKVGSYQPSELGLYDMHGNVYEWCLDWFGDLASTAVSDPVGASSGSYRVIRGGSWSDGAQDCRAAYHNGLDTNYCVENGGFRVACFPAAQ